MLSRRGLPHATAAVALTFAFLLALAPAGAQDPIAPPGAPKTWLPSYGWVLNHFLPYDTRTLYRVLETDDVGLRAFFKARGDHAVPPIMDLARQRGLSRRRLTRLLMRPWRGMVPVQHLAALRRRTTLTLTQGHLLQHMLFHPLHDRAMMEAEPEIFGADHVTVAALRRAGMTLAEIGARFGRTEQDVAAAAESVLRRTMRHAQRRNWTPRGQGRRYLRFQISEIPSWLDFSRQGGASGHQHEAMRSASSLRCSLPR